MTTAKFVVVIAMILSLCGCLDRVHAVKAYQARATASCLKHHSEQACKPLPYPSSDSSPLF